MFLGWANHSPIWHSLSGPMSLAFRQQHLPLLPEHPRIPVRWQPCSKERSELPRQRVLSASAGDPLGNTRLSASCARDEAAARPQVFDRLRFTRPCSPCAHHQALLVIPSPEQHSSGASCPCSPGLVPPARGYGRAALRFPSWLSILPSLRLPAAACSVSPIHTR